MSVEDDFKTILEYAHCWNWVPDWEVAEDVYKKIPDSYSVLTPFVYSYLEELIRSTTSEYGMPFLNKNRGKYKFKVGMGLIKLAKEENADKPEYIALLDKVKKHFTYEYGDISGENGRNKVAHGHLHPRFWSKEEFEQLIHDIAKLSPYAGF